MEAGHLVYMILDCHSPNPLFRSPIIANPKNILDIGTGDGNWAMDVAERYPMATVQGVDLYPPPHTWAPDNCFLEVDDISKEWAFSAKFDLIHIRHLHAAFTLEGWDQLYKRAYDNLQPGGWVEHAELDVAVHCDDTSLPKDALLRGWGPMFKECAARSGQPIDNETSMRARIEAAGFININEKSHILPIGPWARHPVYKDAGRVNHAQWMSGAEGWAMWLLTKHGSPEPWPVEKVGDYIEKIKGELARGYHIYQKSRRVWAQKPLDDRHRPLTAEEEREHEEEMEERRAKRLRSC